MPERSRKPRRPRDPNQLAKFVVETATARRHDRTDTPKREGKNPAAVALGRLGGLKGGKARAQSVTADEKRDIARRAAEARWANKSRNDD
jgi:hypothetical protein